jgi:hypothetical protein
VAVWDAGRRKRPRRVADAAGRAGGRGLCREPEPRRAGRSRLGRGGRRRPILRPGAGLLLGPTDADRLAPVRALDGELTALWDYDQDDEEWSEDYLVGELGITVSNFLVRSVEQFLDDVLVRANTDPVRHMRLAALQRCRPLAGTEMMASWRARADTFPRKLVSALVQQALAPEVLTNWSAREALVSRGDDLAVRDLLTRTGLAAVRATLALNRIYLPHRQLKWQRHLTTGLRLVPDRLAERLESLSNGQLGEALQAAEALLAEIATLAEANCDADIAAFREALSQRRPAIGPPQPGT